MAEESELEALIQMWEAKASDGIFLSAEELCRDHPELLDQVRWKIEDLGELAAAKVQVNQGVTRGPGSYQTVDDQQLKDVPQRDLLETQPFGEVVAIDPTFTTINAAAKFVNVQLHAEGGFGKVCVGNDTDLSRKVAIKFLKPEFLASASDVETFCQEARITGRLDHPGVVPVYNFGTSDDGRPFYVMRFVRGRTFADVIERFHHGRPPDDGASTSPTLRDLLNIFVSVGKTIAYAHSRGVVNRDIKPNNVMLGNYGETLVVDWGSAISISMDTDSTKAGESMILPQRSSTDSSQSQGVTPAYMSPEQAGGSEAVSFATDIYSLGATLYQILTGRTQVSALDVSSQDLPEILDRITEGLVPPPRSIRKQVAAPLENICLKAMARLPRDRYHSALELARDVENYLADRTVSAHEENWWERSNRWLRRHRGVFRTGIVSAGLLSLMLIGFSTFLMNQASELRVARNDAVAAQEESLKVSAHFAAKTVRQRISERLRFLETAAGQPELGKLLQQNYDQPDQEPPLEPLENWLRKCRDEYQEAEADSWFVCDYNGRQLARMVPKKKSLMKSYANRDYFHGKGFDLAEDQISSPPEHITDLHRSSVYVSSTTGLPKVAFAIPIWGKSQGSPEPQFLGILGMSVALGKFGELHQELRPDVHAVLVSLNSELIEGRKYEPGMILHHPRLQSTLEPGRLDFPFIQDSDLVRRFFERKQAKLAQLDRDGPPTGQEPPTNLVRDYHDPLDKDQGLNWIVAFEPVIVPSRTSRALRDPGWVVVVQQRVE